MCASEQTRKPEALNIGYLGKKKRLPRRGTSAVAAAFLRDWNNMLWTIFVVLCVLWLLGMVTSYTMGGLIHLLLVIALIIFIVNLFQGRSRTT